MPDPKARSVISAKGADTGPDPRPDVLASGALAPYALAASATLPESYALEAIWQPGPSEATVFEPGGVDVASDGLVFLAETGRHRVALMHMDARPTQQPFGSRGSGADQFEFPEDLALDDARDRIYVADTGNRRVQVLRRRWQGFEVRMEAEASWPDLGLPRGIAVDPDGRVYVSDSQSHQIRVLDPDGRQLDAWGGFGRGPGQFERPLGIFASESGDGRIFVADSGNQRVQWLESDGTPAGQLILDNSAGPGGAPLDLIVDDRQALHVLVERGVLRFNRLTDYIETILPLLQFRPSEAWLSGNHEGLRRIGYDANAGMSLTYAPRLWMAGGVDHYPSRWFPAITGGVDSERGERLDAPYRLSIDPGSGTLAVLDAGRNVQAMDPDGGALGNLGAEHIGPIQGADGHRHQDLAIVGPNVAVLNGNQVAVYGFPPSFTVGPPRIFEALPEPLRSVRDRIGELVPDDRWWVTAVASAGGNNLALLDSGWSRVVLYTSTGGLLRAIDLEPATGPFQLYTDLASDPRHGLFVLARASFVRPIDDRGRVGDPIPLQGLSPRGAEALALGPDGAFYTLTSDGWVFKFAPDGELRAAWPVRHTPTVGSIDDRDLVVDLFGRVLLVDPADDRILVFAPAEGPSSFPPPNPDGAPCTVQPNKRADPAVLPLGQTTELRLDLSVDCGAAHAALDIALLYQADCSMAGGRLAALRQAGLRFVEAMDANQDRVAVLSYSPEHGADLGGARLLQPLTDDRDLLRSHLSTLRSECLPFVPVTYRMAMAGGLRAAREAFEGPLGRPEAGKAVILLAASDAERDRAMWEARRLRRQDITLHAVSVGQDQFAAGAPADRALLASLADRPSRYRLADSPDSLLPIYQDLGRDITTRRLLHSLTITDRVPIHMRLLPASVSPPATILPNPDPASSALIRWDLAPVPLGAAPPVLSYRLEPLETGRHPTNVDAAAVYTDGLDYPGRVLFPVPEVEVIGPTQSPPPSPTPEASATPLPDITPSPTPSPTLLPTATAGPTGIPIPLHLPILFREQCVPKAQPVDVALVIDTSSSMSGAKLEAARSAARNFIDLLEPSRDRATIVGFDSDARLAQALTTDRAALDRALNSLAPAVGTRIDLGLWTALGELTGANRRPTADRVIVLLTDGRPQLGTEPAMRTAAQLARDVGVATHVIGLGSDVLPGVLRDIAGTEERVYLAPDEAALAAIYREIARLIPCR